MASISTHLWFDHQALEAANFYLACFQGARMISHAVIDGTPSGRVDIVTIDLPGQRVVLINGGPFVAINPSISMMVHVATEAEVDALWSALADGGQPLMPLDSYPWSTRYGWVRDRFGMTWQIMLVDDASQRQTIVPSLMFTGPFAGKAEEAIRYYTSVFDGSGSSAEDWDRYTVEESPADAGTLKYGPFTLCGQSFNAMDSAFDHGFAFNEGVSLVVSCEDQVEIDAYWSALSHVPEAEQCGWCKDRYGVSWQIVPAEMDAMLSTADPATMARIVQAFLPMKKFDLGQLRQAALG